MQAAKLLRRPPLARRVLVLLMACALFVGVATIGKAGASSTSGKKISGGTVTWAEWEGQAPTYIFPMFSAQYFSQVNVGNFQYLMYRPLYWFGNNDSDSIDYNLSLATAPVWSDGGTTVSITLKPYKWSNGETVTSRDIIFWMNLLKANTSNWGAYVPGEFPDNVTSVTAPNATTVVFKLNKAYNQTWFLYNELSQITPLPIAWDRTSATGAAPDPNSTTLPDTTTAGAQAVYAYLNGSATDTAGWASSPVWGVVDGPFKLTSFTNTGQATFVPNGTYSGPVKPSIAKFVEVPVTSPAAEVNLVKSGSNNLTVGYLPDSYLPLMKSIGSSGYSTLEAYTFDSAYWPMNFSNPKFGPVFKQLYFRQAFQHLVDQPGWIKAFFGGDAVPTNGPVPITPANSFYDKTEKSTNPYPFSVASAKTLLKDNGWHVVPGGTTTCAKPGTGKGQCGAGIPKGRALSFNLDYITNSTPLASEMEDLKAQASKVGIQLELTSHPYGVIAGTAIPCKTGASNCNWTMENWQVGWIYGPDYYPTGDQLFETGAATNFGSYSDPTANRLIAATLVSTPATAQAALDAYQNYLAKSVPVIWEPVSSGDPIAAGVTLVSKHLGGYTTNAFGSINPEYWYLTK